MYLDAVATITALYSHGYLVLNDTFSMDSFEVPPICMHHKGLQNVCAALQNGCC